MARPAWRVSHKRLLRIVLRFFECKGHLQRLDEWIWHKLRYVKLKQRKPIADFLQSAARTARLAAGVVGLVAHGWQSASVGSNDHRLLKEQGLVNLVDRYVALKL